VLLDLLRLLLRRFNKGQGNAAASVEDDTQSEGVQHSYRHGQTEDQEHEAPKQLA
jgi:hypothetical protein